MQDKQGKRHYTTDNTVPAYDDPEQIQRCLSCKLPDCYGISRHSSIVCRRGEKDYYKPSRSVRRPRIEASAVFTEAGLSLNIDEWAERIGISRAGVRARIRKGQRLNEVKYMHKNAKEDNGNDKAH